MGVIGDDATRMYEKELLGLDCVRLINILALRIVSEEKDLVFSYSKESARGVIERIEARRSELDKYARDMDVYFYTDGGKVAASRLLAALGDWRKVHEEVVRLALTEDPAQKERARTLSQTAGRETIFKLREVIDEVAHLKSEFARKETEHTTQFGENVRLVSIIATLASVLLGVGMGFLVSRNMLRQLGDEPASVSAIALRIAAGDLDVRFDPNRPEIGVFGAMKQMVATLKGKIDESEQKGREAREESERARQAMRQADDARALAERAKAEGMLQAAGELEGVVEVVSSASEELSAQIEQSSRGAEEQARRVSEAATAIEEMNATVLEVAHNAARAADTSEEARKQAQEGSREVASVIRGINDVREQALSLRGDMMALGQQAEGIGKVLGVISDIADQTNLLALNAAIEAARAGDAGRGFAVVADEVRKLAEKTMTATREVGEAVQGIQESTRKNMTAVDRSSRTIDDATTLAGRAGGALERIVRLVDEASHQVQSIATASQQQTSASEEISRSAEQVATISSETSQAMGQAAVAMSELAHQSQVLQKLIMEMKTSGS